ncbi:B9 domain-containing protein 1 isoform X2 [Megachile rotundata]|uniref:B9 domain-containing protein 1 isoform X2 n=1 Tax=Megachile rotundata TaxID=143995 RepID=UPI003FD59B98
MFRYHDDESYTKHRCRINLKHIILYCDSVSFSPVKFSALRIAMSVEGEFFLSITGSIEYAEFYDTSNAYCKYGFHFGPEWSVVAGIEEGLTQMCKCSSDPRNLAVWNFPLEITFKSTNPHGWPQLIMSIYGLDIFGHDVIRGYGVCHLPLKTGCHKKSDAHEGGGYCYANVQRRAERFLQARVQQRRETEEIMRPVTEVNVLH